jgi:hypothetical protein
MATTTARPAHPKWWKRTYDSAWDKVKLAFRRDWEQTKHDLGGNGTDLNQNVGDTIAQAAGSRPIPAGNQPNYEELEPAFRYGYGARMYYGEKYPEWNDETERRLEEDWPEDWPTSREAVRRGWDYSRESRPAPTA